MLTHQILNLKIGETLETPMTYFNYHHHIMPICEHHHFGEFVLGSNNGFLTIKRIR